MNINDIKKIVTFNASSIPVLFEMCRIARIAETINSMVDWRPDNSKVSPGFLIETLIVTILRGRRPLWKIEEYWAQQKYDLIFKGSGITIEQFNDDAYARALDKLKTVNMKELISRICLTMLQAHDISIESLHLDTTSISVEGSYEDANEGDFKINQGHSKDYRPDLKQFKIGAAVQQDGLPMMGQLLSGNTSDKEWNPEAVLEMKAFFDKHRYKDIILIGDSATVSSFEALDKLKGTLFISRFPLKPLAVSKHGRKPLGRVFPGRISEPWVNHHVKKRHSIDYGVSEKVLMAPYTGLSLPTHLPFETKRKKLWQSGGKRNVNH